MTADAQPLGGSPEGGARDWSSQRREIYAALLADHLDMDGLHQLLADRGAALLDKSVPYLLVAARNRVRSTYRRDSRRSELELEAEGPASSAYGLDPATVVAQQAELDAVIIALGRLDPAYSWPLWWHAAGYSDDEIIQYWDEAGLEPSNPTAASIRKRRERARQQLRRLVRYDEPAQGLEAGAED